MTLWNVCDFETMFHCDCRAKVMLPVDRADWQSCIFKFKVRLGPYSMHICINLATFGNCGDTKVHSYV